MDSRISIHNSCLHSSV